MQITRSLIQELQVIESREELIQHSQNIKNLFDRLVDTMIAAREFEFRHPEVQIPEQTSKSQLLSMTLREELERVYQMEGGRDLLEKIEAESLERLDLFERDLEKRRSATMQLKSFQ